MDKTCCNNTSISPSYLSAGDGLCSLCFGSPRHYGSPLSVILVMLFFLHNHSCLIFFPSLFLFPVNIFLHSSCSAHSLFFPLYFSFPLSFFHSICSVHSLLPNFLFLRTSFSLTFSSFYLFSIFTLLFFPSLFLFSVNIFLHSIHFAHHSYLTFIPLIFFFSVNIFFMIFILHV